VKKWTQGLLDMPRRWLDNLAQTAMSSLVACIPGKDDNCVPSTNAGGSQ